MIPEYTQNQIQDYVDKRYPSGSFLYAVLTNNLIDAVTKADDTNIHCLRSIVLYIYNNTPGICWGNREKVEEWINPTKKPKEEKE